MPGHPPHRHVRHRTAPAPPPATLAAPSRSPFVGRAGELAVLLRHLAEVRTGQGSVVLVVGEPGIGKTRLMEELAHRATATGVLALWGRCWGAGGAPWYWPWTQILRDYAERTDAADVGSDVRDGGLPALQLVPELRARLDPPPASAAAPAGADAQFATLDAVATVLVRASRRRPLLLLIDDLHAADHPSLLLLQFLASRIRHAAVMLCGAYREPEARQDRTVADALAEVARDGTAVPLQGLDPSDVGRLLEQATGTFTEPLVAALHERTEGNPLFVCEIVRALQSADAGDMAAAALADPVIPHSVERTIMRRIRRLPVQTIAIVELAAVVGRDVELALLQRASRVPAGELAQILASAVAAGILHRADGGYAYRFAHPLVREALYWQMPAARRARLHRRVGHALEGTHGLEPGPHLAALGHHFFRAASPETAARAVDYNEQAARRATSLHAHTEAVAAYQRALEALAFTPTPDARRRCGLLVALGDAQHCAGERPLARATFVRAMELARGLGCAQLLARAVLGFGRQVLPSAAVDWTLVDLLEEALRGLGQEEPLRVEVGSRLAVELYDGGDPLQSSSARVAAEALAAALRLGDPTALLAATGAVTLAGAGPDTVAERFNAGVELVDLGRQVGRPDAGLTGRAWRLSALLEGCDVSAADGEIGGLASWVAELEAPGFTWYAELVQAGRALLAGRFAEAERRLQHARRIAQQACGPEAEEQQVLATFVLTREQGRPDALEAVGDALDRLAARHPNMAVYRAAGALARLGAGRPDDARAGFDVLVAGGFTDLPRNLGFLASLCLSAELCAAFDDREVAAPLYDLLLPYADRVALFGCSGTSWGSVARPLGLLASLLERPDDAVDHLRAALRINARLGARPFVAHTQHELASMLLRRGQAGDRAAAAELAGAAMATARSLRMPTLVVRLERLGGGLPAPLGPDGTAAPPPPTVFRREGDVWVIAYEGAHARLKDSKGLRYLARLLHRPGHDVHVLELVAEEGGFVLGGQRSAVHQERLADLRAQLDDAEAMNDPERASGARLELEDLISQLVDAVGGGAAHHAASERARQSVRRAVKAAVERIGIALPALGAHLAATVRTGYLCSYNPDPRAPVRWDTG